MHNASDYGYSIGGQLPGPTPRDKQGMILLREYLTPRGPATCAGAVVLRDKGEGEHQRYVTHWRNDDLGGYIWGHYFDDLAEAEADYLHRCQRGY